MTEREAAIVELLRTRDDHLPEPVRRAEASAGFVHKPRSRTCPDCLANGAVTFDCETCGGNGVVEGKRLANLALPDSLADDDSSRDPYAEHLIQPYGFDATRHDEARERDRQIDMLERQTAAPRSEADMLDEANRHPYAWEIARRRMYRRFDYEELDLALEQLRDVDHDAYRALHAVYVYAWAPANAAPSACARGLAFLDERLPRVDHPNAWKRRPLRAPAPQPQRRLVGKVERSAGPVARSIRDDRIRELAAAGKKPNEIAVECFVSIRTVYNVCRQVAA